MCSVALSRVAAAAKAALAAGRRYTDVHATGFRSFRPAGDVRRVVGGSAGGRECPRRGGWIVAPNERFADQRTVEPEGAPAGDGHRLADARFGDDQPVVRDELADPHSCGGHNRR